MAKFFKVPFAISGDKTAIPEAIQPSGSVSYTEGFGFDYQRDSDTDPAFLDIDRAQFNQLANDMTSAIQQYQTFGFPDFITTTDNGGTPYSYSKYAIVKYDDGVHGPRVYQSSADSNIALPTDDTKWDWLDFKTTSDAVVLEDAVFEGTVIDGDSVYWNTSTTQFTKAVANGTATQNMIGIADVTNKRVYFSGLVPVLTGLTPGSVYYLSASSPGGVTTVGPLTNIIRVGIAKSTTELFLLPMFQSGFTAVLGAYETPCFTFLPNGILIQIGFGATANPPGNFVNFPIVFPNAVMTIITCGSGLGSTTAVYNPGAVSLNGFNFSSQGGTSGHYIAIGY